MSATLPTEREGETPRPAPADPLPSREPEAVPRPSDPTVVLPPPAGAPTAVMAPVAMPSQAALTRTGAAGTAGRPASLESGLRVTPPRLFADYELLAPVGRGGMGIVYRARDTRLGRIVALKVLAAADFTGEAEVKRFEREAAAAARLRHPGIVAVHDFGQFEQFHYYTMDFVEGRALVDVLRDGPLEIARAVEVARKVAEALDCAHRAGIVHRDVKPANILLDARGEPMLTDFGLAKVVQAGTQLTAAGSAVGTPSYMSPEQATGRLELVDARSDVYSLGAVLYEMLTGRLPFEGDSPLAIMQKVVRGEPRRPREVNPRIDRVLEAIVERAMERDFQRRYPGIAALAEDLRRYLAGEAVLARRVGPSGRLWRRARARPLAAALIGGGLVVLVAGAWSVFALRASARRFAEAESRAAQLEQREARLRAAAPWVQRAREYFDQADRMLYVPSDDAVRRMRNAWSEGSAAAREALRLAPEHVEARLLLARILMLSDENQEALESVRAVLASTAPPAEARMLEARILVELYQETFRTSWRLEPGGVVVFDFSARETERGRALRASVLATLRAHDPVGADDRTGRRVAALEAMVAADWKSCVRLLEDLEEDRFADLPYFLTRALARIHGGDAASGIHDLDRLLAIQPNHADALEHRSFAYQILRNYRAAETDTTRCLNIHPERAAGYGSRAILRRHLGDVEGALADYDRALELAPAESRFHANRAMLLHSVRRYDEALAGIEAALRLAPETALLHGTHGRILHDRGDLDGALQAYERALARDATLVQVYYSRAQILVERKQPDRSRGDLDRAIALSPDYVEALNLRAQVLLQLEKYDEGLRDAARVIELTPDFAGGYWVRGHLAWKAGRGQEALEDFGRVLAREPKAVGVRYTRALVLEQLGRPDEAREECAILLRDAPNDPLANQARQLLEKLGEKK